MNQSDRFVREGERRQLTGVSRMTWFRLEKDGQAPKRRSLSPRTVAWLESELRAWMAERAGQVKAA
jgi:prophage regulatory protein